MSANRANIHWHLHNMVGGPAAKAAVQVIFKTEDGILFCYGTAAHTVLEAEAADTYAPGCIYLKHVAGGPSIMYHNIGAAGAVAEFYSVDSTTA